MVTEILESFGYFTKKVERNASSVLENEIIFNTIFYFSGDSNFLRI